MIVLLVHLLTDSIEVSLVRKYHDKASSKKDEVFLSRSFPLHSDLKAYLQEAHSRLASTRETIDNVVCILGAAFFTAESKTINKIFDSSTKIDDNLLKKLTSTDKKGVVIENEILQARINGYPVLNPVGKDANDIDLVVYQSRADEGIIDEFKNTILPISKKLTFHTFPFVSFKVLSASRKNNRPFMMIKVERTATTFSLINSEAYIETLSMDMGIARLIKVLEEDFNADEKVVFSLFKMFKENTIDEKNRNRMEEALKKGIDAWKSEMLQVFAKLSNGRPLPSEIYLIVPQEWNDLFKEALSKNDYSTFAYDNSELTVKILDFSDLLEKVIFEVPLENRFVTLIDVLFIDRYLV